MQSLFKTETDENNFATLNGRYAKKKVRILFKNMQNINYISICSFFLRNFLILKYNPYEKVT